MKSPVFERLLSSVRRDRKISALVLDIDSPGGSVSASEYLYECVVKVSKEKTVIACIRGTGASGAYLISCAADRIVAISGAIVGSIGVVSIRPVLEDLLRRTGIRVNVNKSGTLKDMGAFWREPTPEESEKTQSLIDESFDRFISIVAKSRKIDESEVRKLATGEVFWGIRAKELALVDELGGLDRAIDLAAELSGAPRKPVFVRPHRGLKERIFGPLSESFIRTALDELENRIWLNSLRY